MAEINPLSKYFRVPGLHVKLASKGYFSDDKDVTITNDIPVYPMGAAEELYLKNPDGLLNGFSIETIIKNCVPDIKNPRKLPVQDIDVLLLAIKHATFGDNMEINVVCPKCSTEQVHNMSILNILDSITYMENEYTVRLNDDLVVYLKPYCFETNTKLSLATFEEIKIQQSITNDDELEKKLEIINESFIKMTSINLDLMAKTIIKIATPDGEITNIEHIKEFILKASKKFIDLIKAKHDEISNTGIKREFDLICTNCNHEWKDNIVFDPSNFFTESS
jgi:hypothetical protein